MPYAGPPKWFFPYAWPYIWENKISPMQALRKMGTTISKHMLSRAVRDKLGGALSQERQEALEEFAHLVIWHEGTTESVLFDLFQLGIFPYIAIKDQLDDIPMSFIYGDRDWVDSVGAEVVITSKIKRGLGETCQLHVVPNASH